MHVVHSYATRFTEINLCSLCTINLTIHNLLHKMKKRIKLEANKNKVGLYAVKCTIQRLHTFILVKLVVQGIN